MVEEIDTHLEGPYKECACGFDDFLLPPSEDTIKRTHAATGMSECPSTGNLEKCIKVNWLTT